MRIYTENDKKGLCVALRILLRNRYGKSMKAATLMPAIEKALAAGLSADEILNAANYARAEVIMPESSPEDLISCMAERRIETREITEEEGWSDDLDTMNQISEIFHEFYITICPKGGTWSTSNARMNLEKAIRRNSLDSILSEKLIMEVIEKSGIESLTCFNYISIILKDQEKYNIEKEPSEERKKRLEEGSQMLESLVKQEETDEKTAEENEEIALTTESEADETDIDLYPFDDDFNDDRNWTPTLNERTTFIGPDPEKRKYECIAASIFYLSPLEIVEISKTVPPCSTLKELIEKLTSNELNPEKETLQARKVHQTLSADLAPAFLECIRLQGIEINDDEIERHDPLTENWDFRDPNSRKKEKILRLIEKYGEDDPDLNEAAVEIDKFFSKTSTDLNLD